MGAQIAPHGHKKPPPSSVHCSHACQRQQGRAPYISNTPPPTTLDTMEGGSPQKDQGQVSPHKHLLVSQGFIHSVLHSVASDNLTQPNQRLIVRIQKTARELHINTKLRQLLKCCNSNISFGGIAFHPGSSAFVSWNGSQ